MRPSKRGLALGCLLWLGCSPPDLGHTLFSCATDADCGPGQMCLEYQDGLACQRPLTPAPRCPGGICSTGEPASGGGPLQAAMPDAGTPAEGVCREGNCNPALPLSPAQQEPAEPDGPGAAMTDAGTSTVADPSGVSADAAATPPAGDGPGEPDAAPPPVEEGPPIRHDFEEGREGWQSVPDQVPEDTLDGTEQTTELAHHGAGALRMVYDGEYSPVAGITPENSFYGAFLDGAPPPGAEVSLWMLSTAPGVSVEVYSRPDPPGADTILATVPLLQDEWREIRVIMPLVEARLFGVLVRSELDLEGFVYLDEIRW